MQIPILELLGMLAITKSAQIVLTDDVHVHLNSRRREKSRSGLVTISYRLAVSYNGGRDFVIYTSFGQDHDAKSAKRQAGDRLLNQLQ